MAVRAALRKPITSPWLLGDAVSLQTSSFTALSSVTDAQAARFLLQAGFAATDADIASVRNLGICRLDPN